jgi:group I intron endonuclease
MNDKIYKITCTINKTFYIGRTYKSLYARLAEHLAVLKNGNHNQKFQRCYNKYGPESFIIELLENASAENIRGLEEHYINKYWGDKKLLNCSKNGTGGHTTAGYSEEELAVYKAKLSVSKLGDKNHFYGKRHSEASIEKQRLASTGKKQSEETKAKRVKTMQAIGPPNAKLTLEQVITIRSIYSGGNTSYSALAKQYNVSKTAIMHIIKCITWRD